MDFGGTFVLYEKEEQR